MGLILLRIKLLLLRYRYVKRIVRRINNGVPLSAKQGKILQTFTPTDSNKGNITSELFIRETRFNLRQLN